MPRRNTLRVYETKSDEIADRQQGRGVVVTFTGNAFVRAAKALFKSLLGMGLDPDHAKITTGKGFVEGFIENDKTK